MIHLTHPLALLAPFIIGSFATWCITYNLVGFPAPGVQLSGPFGIYDRIRSTLRSERMPKWVQDGIDCEYCISVWVAHLVAIFVAPTLASIDDLRLYLGLAWGMAGVVAAVYRALKHFGINEFQL